MSSARRWTAVCASAVLAASLAACSGPKESPGSEPEPDLASIRAVSWTKTAHELAGVPKGTEFTEIQGFGPGSQAIGGPASSVSGDLILTSARKPGTVTVAALSPRTGAVVWRRQLRVTEDGYADCRDDGGGPSFVCKVVDGPENAYVRIFADRSGKARTARIPVDRVADVGIAGPDVYLATFKPAEGDTRLKVVVERRPWKSSRPIWKRETSFAIEGWGHDGDAGFLFGNNRIVAYSANWQVVLDRPTGRLLDRSDQGRWEQPLARGRRLVVDSGDGSTEQVTVTLFAPDGRPIAETRESLYPIPLELTGSRVVVGRRVLSVATGRTVFAAPKGHRIVAVAGGRALVEPDELGDEPAKHVPFTVYDVESGRQTGSFAARGDSSGDTVAGGDGVLKVTQSYDDESGENLPPRLYVIDARKPGVVATIDLDPVNDFFGSPTFALTRFGAVVTSSAAIRGLVAR